MHFEIKPYISIGPLIWTMKPNDVELILGPASRSSKNRFGNIVELREKLGQTCIYDGRSNNLIEVTFSEPNIIFFEDVDLLGAESKSIIHHLYSFDAIPLSGFGSVIFPNIGIALTGYDSENSDIRAAGAFSRGRWDSVMPKMKKMKVMR